MRGQSEASFTPDFLIGLRRAVLALVREVPDADLDCLTQVLRYDGDEVTVRVIESAREEIRRGR